METIFILVAFMIILFIAVVLIHKFLRFAGTILMYVITIGIIISIIFLIYVQYDFSKYVKELEEKNLFLVQNEGEIIAGFESKPFNLFSAEELAEIKSTDRSAWLENRHNAFIFNRNALEAVRLETVTFDGTQMSRGEAVGLVFSAEDAEEKGDVFSELISEYDSDFFIEQYRKGNIESLPDRALNKYIRRAPRFLSGIFGFKNEVK
ncbi:hypothetical protein KY325_04605 [Candidatus Woesearchaeota archaeon]|nr:hypothetical protein [Candidatus Woesearchaeota archaeon]MBW3018415.1 hypothetical protein [Candidatus Woesearchaeota archaeon]